MFLLLIAFSPREVVRLPICFHPSSLLLIGFFYHPDFEVLLAPRKRFGLLEELTK